MGWGLEPLCGTGQEYGSKSGFVMVAISVSCLAKEEEKIPRHHPHHINQPREHNGEDLTEGNQGARFSTRSFLLPSISLTLPVCRPVSGVDPKRKKKKSLCPPIVGCTAHYISLSLSFSFCSYEGAQLTLPPRWSSLNTSHKPDSFFARSQTVRASSPAGLQSFPFLLHHRQKNNRWMYLGCNTRPSRDGKRP